MTKLYRKYPCLHFLERFLVPNKWNLVLFTCAKNRAEPKNRRSVWLPQDTPGYPRTPHDTPGELNLCILYQYMILSTSMRYPRTLDRAFKVPQDTSIGPSRYPRTLVSDTPGYLNFVRLSRHVILSTSGVYPRTIDKVPRYPWTPV